MQPSPTAATSAPRRAVPPPLPLSRPADAPLLHAFTDTVVGLCRNDDQDLTARQLGVLLTVITKPGPHTVRGMATALNVNKPAITRALDRLSELCLVKREMDPADRRSVLVVAQSGGHRVVAGISASLCGRAARAEG